MRLIDADALQRKVCGAKCGCEYEECGNEGDCKFDHFISHAPTVDAAEVRHGKWERTDITEESGWALYRCPCCNWHTTYYYSFSASPTYNFCPNCGAKMSRDGD